MTGTINADATITGEDGNVYNLSIKGTSPIGEIEVLVDATRVGGKGTFAKQPINPFIGMKVNFMINPAGGGYNYTIIK